MSKNETDANQNAAGGGEPGDRRRLPQLQLKDAVTVRYDEDEICVCSTFLEYVRAMMLPDPTYVELPVEDEMKIVRAVNAGASIRRALALHGGYQYDDEGKEYIAFPSGMVLDRALEQMLSPVVIKGTPCIIYDEWVDGAAAYITTRRTDGSETYLAQVTENDPQLTGIYVYDFDKYPVRADVMRQHIKNLSAQQSLREICTQAKQRSADFRSAITTRMRESSSLER